jgi:hypothetical protein
MRSESYYITNEQGVPIIELPEGEMAGEICSHGRCLN